MRWGRRSAGAALLLALGALLPHRATAIFEDQAGELDWSVQNLGRVVATVYGPAAAPGAASSSATAAAGGVSARAAFVATDARARALARIDAKSGAVKWRHVLARGDAVDALELSAFGLLAVSGAGQNVRMWEPATGALLWDNVLGRGDDNGAAAFGGVALVGDDRALVVTSRAASFVGLKDGVVHWRAAFAETPFERVHATALGAGGSTLFVLGDAAAATSSMSSSRKQLLSVDVTTGAVARVAAPLDTIGDNAASLYTAASGEAALVAVVNGDVQIQSLETKTKTFVWKAAEVASEKGAARFVGLETHVKHALVARLASGKRVFARLLDSLVVEVVAVLSGEGVVSESASAASAAMVDGSADEAAMLVHTVATSRSEVRVRTYSLAKQLDQLQWDAEVDVTAHGGAVANVFAACPSRKKDAAAPRCRALLVMQDDGLVMTANEDAHGNAPKTPHEKDTSPAVAATGGQDARKNVLWVREEALANINEVHWITPAETAIEKQPLKGIPSFVEDLQQDVERVKQLVQHVVALSSSLLEQKTSGGGAHGGAAAKKKKTRTEPANAHFFGFSKYIVLLTESGRLFAIRAETSEVAWSVFVGTGYRLFVTRDHPALGAGAELLLVSNTTLLWIDGDDGRQVESADATAPHGVWAVLLPKRKHTVDDDATVRRAIALVARDTLDVTILPRTAPGTSHPEAENFYFSRFDEASNAFVGYTIEAVADGSFKARQVWSMVLPAEQQLVATSRQREVVIDSAVTVTGDDSLLLKYLNPHMFGVATQATETLEGEAKSTAVLYVSLVDSVTGRVIHRVRHLHGAGPVQMVQSENWIVYAFWNSKEKRTEMVSVSMFDGAVGSHSLNLWKRPSWSDFRSSYDPRTPFVLQKSFIFPTRIETLSVTVTARGITPQYVLVGLENGQIFKLNRGMIDPRQPEKPPTPQEQEEGLHQYTPLVPMYNNLQSMVTYNQTIANLKAIATTAAELESTSLVFAHGLDYFYVRLAPAKAFDVLPQDFNYELLVLLCLGFLSATYGLKMLTLRKSLNEAWK